MRHFDADIWRDVTGGTLGERIRKLLRVTPLVPAPALSRRSGADVWLKLENLQRTGSFKARGASARLAALPPGTPVVAASAGNHGLGIAYAAAAFGLPASILVPAETPRTKREGIAALGAKLEVFGKTYDQAEAEARRRAAADSNLVFVSPFDDDHVIAGNGGLLGRELLAQLPDVEIVVCPVGGGGLLGGLGVELAPRGIRLFGVEPEGNCAMYQSLEQKRALTEYTGGPTLAEGLEGAVAERTFRMAQDYCETVGLVSESGIRRAIAYAYRTLGVMIEASAAVSVAALLDDVLALSARRVVLVITGGNIEPDLLDQVLGGSTPVGI